MEMLTGGMDVVYLMMAGMVVILLLFLVLSFAFRPLLFCQYLKHMAGFDLKPKDVKEAYHKNKAQGVRDLFLEHYIKDRLALTFR